MELQLFKELKAKDKFREGFIMLNRPFKFGDLDFVLQKMTILYVYSEKPIVKEVLTKKAIEEIDLIENQSIIPYIHSSVYEFKEKKIESILNSKSSHEEIYEGEVVRTEIQGKICRFYPDEYRVVSNEKLLQYLEHEGYHTIISNTLKDLKIFKDQSHYLRSRGIPKRIAEKWASFGFKDLVIYKPYYDMLDNFCRPHEILKDKFYEEVEGIVID